jgi:hypothetical protein
MAVMKMQREVKMLTIKMNFINSLGPHTGSSNLPIKRRQTMLITTYKNILMLMETFSLKQQIDLRKCKYCNIVE